MAKNKKISTYVLVSFAAAVALGGILTYFTLQFYQKVDVIVVANTVEPYSRVLTKEDFKTIQVAKADKQYYDGFVTDINALVGKLPTTIITENLPVMPSQIIDPDSATDVATIVTDKKDRGVYLTLNKERALNGDVKVGSVLDFYIETSAPKPLPNDPQYEETYVVPFQKSYKVTKCIVNEDGSVSIFFEFPMEESEKYLMLNAGIEKKTFRLLATLPNAIHDKYNDSKTLTLSDFQNTLLSNSSYFTSVSDLFDSRTDVANGTNIDISINSSNDETKTDKK